MVEGGMLDIEIGKSSNISAFNYMYLIQVCFGARLSVDYKTQQNGVKQHRL